MLLLIIFIKPTRKRCCFREKCLLIINIVMVLHNCLLFCFQIVNMEIKFTFLIVVLLFYIEKQTSGCFTIAPKYLVGSLGGMGAQCTVPGIILSSCASQKPNWRIFWVVIKEAASYRVYLGRL